MGLGLGLRHTRQMYLKRKRGKEKKEEERERKRGEGKNEEERERNRGEGKKGDEFMLDPFEFWNRICVLK